MDDYLPTAVYSLCALTCFVCTLMLLRGYRRSGQRLQLLIAVSFAGLTVNNILLPIDMVLFTTEIDLSIIRSAVGLGSVGGLLLFLIWEAR